MDAYQCHADPLFIPPNCSAVLAPPVGPQRQCEMVGDANGASYVEYGPEFGHIANYAVDRAVAELNFRLSCEWSRASP